MKRQIVKLLVGALIFGIPAFVFAPRIFLIYNARKIAQRVGPSINTMPSSRQVACTTAPNVSSVTFQGHHVPLLWGSVKRQEIDQDYGGIEFENDHIVHLFSMSGARHTESIMEPLSSDERAWASHIYGENDQVSDRSFYERSLKTTYDDLNFFGSWSELLQKYTLLTSKALLLSDSQVQSLTMIEDGDKFAIAERTQSPLGEKVTMTIFDHSKAIFSTALLGEIKDAENDCFLKGISAVGDVGEAGSF